MSFEIQTKRQYKLSIYAFKYDNDTSVIAIYRYTYYKNWTNKVNIKKELLLTYTYKSNKRTKYIR